MEVSTILNSKTNTLYKRKLKLYLSCNSHTRDICVASKKYFLSTKADFLIRSHV